MTQSYKKIEENDSSELRIPTEESKPEYTNELPIISIAD